MGNDILKPYAVDSVSMAGMQITKQSGRDMLVCRKCAARFPEGRATKDGWHYECPECGDADGIGDGLRRA